MRFKWFGLLAVTTTLFVTACSQQQSSTQGYIEGDLTYMASSQGGRLMKLDVERGEKVKKGQVLFQIEKQPRLSKLHAAEASLNEAQRNLDNLLRGQRPSRLSALDAQINAAKAQVVYTQLQLKRNATLVESDAVQKQQLDLARQNATVALEKVKQLQANLVTANLPARVNEVKAAQAQAKQALAQLNEAKWTLSETAVKAPANATVFDNLYWPGEQVSAAQPVVTLLVPTQIKAVFFVPEAELASLKLGETIQIQAQNNSEKSSATISFISPSAEYTPPVIYSRDRADKLVYRVEARFATAQKAYDWHPGQPINIDLPKA